MAITPLDTFNTALAKASKTTKSDAASYYDKLNKQRDTSENTNLLSSMKDSLTKMKEESSRNSSLNTTDKLIKVSTPTNKQDTSLSAIKTMFKQNSKPVGIIKTEKNLNLKTQDKGIVSKPIIEESKKEVTKSTKSIDVDKINSSFNKLPDLLSSKIAKTVPSITKEFTKSLSKVKIPQSKISPKPTQEVTKVIQSKTIEKKTEQIKPQIVSKVIEPKLVTNKEVIKPTTTVINKPSKEVITKVEKIIEPKSVISKPQIVSKENKILSKPSKEIVKSVIKDQKQNNESVPKLSTSIFKQLETIKTTRIENKPLKLNEFKAASPIVVRDKTEREVSKKVSNANQFRLDNVPTANADNKKTAVFSSFLIGNFADTLAKKIAIAIESSSKKESDNGFTASTIDPLQ